MADAKRTVLIVLFIPSDKLRAFCRRMGKGTNQGEIGLVIDGEYLAITDY